ncbi:hypothetical protein JCM3775_003697 [Rhodotorula graminis]
MTEPEVKCVVFQEPATTRCSACSREPFCSRRCQALLWKSHKVLCHRDPNVFYLPPLRPDEIDTLREFQDVPLRQGERLVDAAAPDQYGADLRAAMNEYFTSIGEQGPLANPNLEHERLMSILFANEFLELARQAKLRRAGVLHDLAATPPTPWEVLGRLGNILIDDYYIAIYALGEHPDLEAARNRVGRGPFNTLNRALRQELVSATITARLIGSVHVLGSNPIVSLPELARLQRKSQLAVLDELDRADLPPSVRDHLKVEYCADVDRQATGEMPVTLTEELRNRR